jgi:ABC-2 type transport system permease protein
MSAAVALEFARIGFVNMLAFRLRYYTGVITYLINVTVYYFIWRAVFAAGPSQGGFRFEEMITYVAVGWIIRSVYFNNVDVEMAEDILEGRITMTMLKPAGVQATYIARAMGESAFRLLMLTAPAALAIGLVFPVRGPASAANFAAFVPSVAGSVLVVAGMNFIVGTCAVSLKSILGLLRAKFWMQDLLSGLLAPIALFPSPLREAMTWLPFEHIGYTPMMIYLGKLDAPGVARALAVQWAWAVALLWLGARFWDRMSRRITIHGG